MYLPDQETGGHITFLTASSARGGCRCFDDYLSQATATSDSFCGEVDAGLLAHTEVQGTLNSAPETYQDEKKRSSSSVVLSTAAPLPEISGG